MNFEQRKRFVAQQPALRKAISYSTHYQNEQANKKSEPPKKSEPEKKPEPPKKSEPPSSEEHHFRTGRQF
jgi:hypothetical protein